MPVNISGKTFYLTHEALDEIGISRKTLYNWVKENKVKDAKYRDNNGWRLFTKQEIESIKKRKETLKVK